MAFGVEVEKQYVKVGTNIFGLATCSLGFLDSNQIQ